MPYFVIKGIFRAVRVSTAIVYKYKHSAPEQVYLGSRRHWRTYALHNELAAFVDWFANRCLPSDWCLTEKGQPPD
jgi:hypothetical protein